MFQRPPSSPEMHGSESPDDEIPCTGACFGVPPQSLSSALWQILPQFAAGGAVLLASCVGGEAP
jgi:hypothetical protein